MTLLPHTRFRGDGKSSPALTASEVIEWLKNHRYIWYQAPMNFEPQYASVTSAVKTWKLNPARFMLTIQDGDGLKYRIDEGHLDRLRLKNAEWHHGISATVCHVHNIGPYSNVITNESRGYLRRYRPDNPILKTQVQLTQSNGYIHTFDTLRQAIAFAARQHYELTAHFGRRERILVPFTSFR